MKNKKKEMNCINPNSNYIYYFQLNKSDMKNNI